MVRDLVDSWRDRGAVDLAEDLAWPMPFDVFFHVMGLPNRREKDPEQSLGGISWSGGRTS